MLPLSLALIFGVVHMQSLLIPSQVIKRPKAKIANQVNECNTGELVIETKQSDNNIESEVRSLLSFEFVNDSISKSPEKNTSKKIPLLSGYRANAHWRAINFDDLRKHPLYIALPEAQDVFVQSSSDFCRFRQDSWQWDTLHVGRLTTSKASSCLGFYESKISKFLDIPRSLCDHDRALLAWEQLIMEPSLDIEYLNREFRLRNQIKKSSNSQNRNDAVSSSQVNNKAKIKSYNIWKQNFNINGKFPYHYNAMRNDPPSTTNRRGYASISSSRLAWGSAQEATAILAVINYFYRTNQRDVRISECGLCPLEAVDDLPEIVQRWQVEGTLPLIGASPDGLITYPDGSKEVLEVKCVSPFKKVFTQHDGRTGDNHAQQSTSNKNTSTGSSSNTITPNSNLMTINKSPLPAKLQGIGAWHIPQLQLEILSAGKSCRGALLISLTALHGAIIYRVERNDEYILNMLHWLRRFHIDYIMSGTSGGSTSSITSKESKKGGSIYPRVPPDNFRSLNDKDYLRFLEDTKRLAREAVVVATLQQSDIQRSTMNDQFFFDS